MDRKRRILYIAPLPPPVTGQSVACRALYTKIKKDYDVVLVNYAKSTFRSGITSINRIIEILRLWIQVARYQQLVDLVYVNLSQSIPGNLKDLITLLLCRRRKIIVHLHGGGLKHQVFLKSPVLAALNRRMLQKVFKIIVLGDSLKSIFHNLVDEEKITVVENFADEHLFLEEHEIIAKYDDPKRRFIYLSNMMEEKGYRVLLEATKALSEAENARIKVMFIGGFDNPRQKTEFLNELRDRPYLSFEGVVTGIERKRYLKKAQVFCLPTYYRYEGQPISILEAYAAGCCVITTDVGGIRDIFEDRRNGLQVKPRSVESLTSVLVEILNLDRGSLEKIGLVNHETAKKKYRESRFLSRMIDLFESALY